MCRWSTENQYTISDCVHKDINLVLLKLKNDSHTAAAPGVHLDMLGEGMVTGLSESTSWPVIRVGD